MLYVLPIIAEVLDKEDSIVTVWALFGSIGIIGFLLGGYRRWWWASGVFSIVALILGGVYYEEFSSVGLLSSGESPSYVAQFYVAAASGALLPIIGAVIGAARKRRI